MGNKIIRINTNSAINIIFVMAETIFTGSDHQGIRLINNIDSSISFKTNTSTVNFLLINIFLAEIKQTIILGMLIKLIINHARYVNDA